MNECARPRVFDYTDFRTYVNDWFTWKQSQRPGFSRRVFATKAGEASNPKLFQNLVSGKRNLSHDRAMDIGLNVLRLEGDELDDFLDLVTVACGTHREREAALDRVEARRHLHASRGLGVRPEAERYLSSWRGPAVRELVRMADFRPDPVWIASRLTPDTTPEEAEATLQMLLDTGLVSRDEHGRMQVSEVTLMTDTEADTRLVFRYHLEMHECALAALERALSGEDRRAWNPRTRFHGLTVSLHKDQLPEVKALFGRFYRDLLALCDLTPGAPTDVYQVNMQLFPLTETSRETP